MYYVEIFNGTWICAFAYMCKSIASYYADLISRDDKCLTRVHFMFTL